MNKEKILEIKDMVYKTIKNDPNVISCGIGKGPTIIINVRKNKPLNLPASRNGIPIKIVVSDVPKALKNEQK